MSTELPIFSVLILLAAGQGLFLAITLMIAKKGNWQANRYLGLFTLAVALAMVDYCIEATVTSESALFLRTLFWPRDYLYGAAFYFYAREMTLPGKYPLLPRQWLHFLPAILHAAFYWTLPFLNTPLHKAILADEDALAPELESAVQSIVNVEIQTSILHLAVYLWLSIRVLNAHRERIKSTFSFDERISLGWLRTLLYGVIAVYLIWIFEELLSDAINLSDIFEYLLGASMVVLVYAMSFLGLRQPVIFTGQTAELVLTENDSAQQDDKTKYKTSSLSDDLSQQLVAELQQLMGSTKPYLDSQLSLPQLAQQLGVSVNYLSQIINEQLQQNFFEFVNYYRVDEAKAFLSDKSRRQENILTVALDCGFNSKSSFYTAFKKHTGLTPGQYRKQA